ncbi:hypothetical protein RWE15_06200 [Virgibacillus halophilus]|uniref:Uncharacterized protein n=1 Tax=Tigheibacillus halophilus TaxID=361280 RepID=A0ABU5C623_9BACI|nr:hypothetical protein [Virgibacillus halophilus]
MKGGEMLGWLDTNALIIREMLGVEVDNKFVPYPDKKNINFVNMGRLSPEKAQDNLIYAFSNFHKKTQK